MVDRPASGENLGTPDSITIAPDGSALVSDEEHAITASAVGLLSVGLGTGLILSARDHNDAAKKAWDDVAADGRYCMPDSTDQRYDEAQGHHDTDQ